MTLFSDTFAPSGLGPVRLRARECPACGSASLEQGSGGDAMHWLCLGCGRCWRPLHGKLFGVDPLSCHGCASRNRSDCVALFASTFPLFGPDSLD